MAHIWTDEDTLCRMWSTGGMGWGRAQYDLFEELGERQLCAMCAQKEREL